MSSRFISRPSQRLSRLRKRQSRLLNRELLKIGPSVKALIASGYAPSDEYRDIRPFVKGFVHKSFEMVQFFWESEENMETNLLGVFSADQEIKPSGFGKIIDVQQIQSLMDDFYKLTNIGMAILDLTGDILVSTGWQDICTKFHRVHPQAHKNCIESDLYLTQNVKEGEYHLYKCKNKMWDIVTPIFLGGKHVANLFLGQFFFEDEVPDLDVFIEQAEHYGFDRDEYLVALNKVPKWSREKVDTVMTFYSKFASLVGQLSYSNLKLANTLVERRRYEEALEKSEMFLHQIVENIPDMIFVKEAENLRFVRFNKAGEDLLGYSREELLGKNDNDIFPKHEADFFTGKDREVLHHGQLVEILEETIQTRHRGERLLHTKKISVFADLGNPQYLLGISEDITERKRAEQEKEALQAQLFQSQKMEALGTLVGGIAHDFNNMLQIILGYSQILLDDKKKGEPGYKELQTIIETGKGGADLVKKLLAFGQQTPIFPVPLDLNHQISQLTTLLSRTLPQAVQVDLDLVDGPATIRADHNQLDQVIVNLAINASEAMPNGGRLKIATKTVSLDDEYCRSQYRLKPGNYVILSVSDTGRGMDKETLVKIFNPFFSTKERGSTRGTGLGLSVVQGIVQQQGGHVTCESEPGKGTEFKIYFPAIEASRMTAKTVVPTVKSGGEETILVVEDNIPVAELERKILTNAGYTVIVAING
ncbi:MAG: PocR ligand-binding domain-containing protein, partial [Deltaproteobacteria bacterium]|nr:PocR ligand-binding domain-containing protein [Deltaproteobacteria bacterium]